MTGVAGDAADGIDQAAPGGNAAARSVDPETLREADNRLLRGVDGLSDAQLAEPSLLPGWSRGHVVAHLALHAEAASGVLEGVLHREPRPLYASPADREAEIEALAASPSEELRDRLLVGTARFRDLLDRLVPDQWEAPFSQVPDGPELPVGVIPESRWREVEVHHADLDVGYGPDQWPTEFAVALVERTVADRAGSGPLGLHATDLGHTWWVDDPTSDAMVATGPVAQLAWWLTGRGDREALHASAGRPPSLGHWR